MLRHLFQSASANILRAPLTAAANIVTLAIGLACFFAAWGISTYWSSGDGYHPGADRIYYISQSFAEGPTGPMRRAAPIWSSRRLAFELRQDVPELEIVAQIQADTGEAGAVPASAGDRNMAVHVAATEPSIFSLFSFKFLEGAPTTALRAPNDVVLTKETAQRLFGEEPALGKSLRLDSQMDVVVSGVIAPVRQPSFMGHTAEAPMRFDILANVALQGNDIPQSWGSIGGTTLVRLPAQMPLKAFQVRLDELAKRARNTFAPVHLTAVPLREIVPRIIDAQFLGNGSAQVTTRAILLALGVLVLGVACTNFANLAAAQAVGRLKEIGMHRVLGAGRATLAAQYFLEAVFLAVPAFLIAVSLISLATPVIRNLLGVNLGPFLLSTPGNILALLGITFGAAIIASLYPVFTVTRIRAADALGPGLARAGSGILARILVGVQFLSVSLLVIIVAVSQLQHSYLRDQAFGRGRDPVVVLDQYEPLGIQFETLKAELLRAPQIRSVTAATLQPWVEEGMWRSAYLGASPQGGRSSQSPFLIKTVADDYFETFGRKTLAGRVFDRKRDRSIPGLMGALGAGRERDTSPARELPSIVIDQRLSDAMGYRSAQAAVGRTIYAFDGKGSRPAGVVMGVIEADNPALSAPYGGTWLEYDPDNQFARQVAVRIDPADISGALAYIRQSWRRLAPDIPARPILASDLFEQSYAPFRKIFVAFTALSLCALVISTTGLLGIAVHIASRRRRELGIRKTLGATTIKLCRLLLVEFSKPVLIAGIAAWPLGYLAARAFLEPFSQRIDLTLTPFVFSLVATLLVAWLAVIGVVLKAASVRPAEVLRHS